MSADQLTPVIVGIPIEAYCKDLSEKLRIVGTAMDREGHYVSAEKIRAVLENRPSVPHHAPLCSCSSRYDAIPCTTEAKKSTTACFSCGGLIAVDALPSAKTYPALACKVNDDGLVVPCNVSEGKTITVCDHCDKCPRCIQAKECSVCKRVGLWALSGNRFPVPMSSDWFSCQDRAIYMERQTEIGVCLQCAHDKSLEELKADLLKLAHPVMEQAHKNRLEKLAIAVERKKELDALRLDTHDERSIEAASDMTRCLHYVFKAIKALGYISDGPIGLHPGAQDENARIWKRQRDDADAVDSDYRVKRKKEQ